MRLYKLFYTGEVEASDDYNEAKEEFEACRVGEIIEDGTVGFELELIDVQQFPREPGGALTKNLVNSESGHGDKPSEGSFSSGVVPEPQVTHPWDQGLWIFPEDHPLHGVEVAAKVSGQYSVARELLALTQGGESHE